MATWASTISLVDQEKLEVDDPEAGSGCPVTCVVIASHECETLQQEGQLPSVVVAFEIRYEHYHDLFHFYVRRQIHTPVVVPVTAQPVPEVLECHEPFQSLLVCSYQKSSAQTIVTEMVHKVYKS